MILGLHLKFAVLQNVLAFAGLPFLRVLLAVLSDYLSEIVDQLLRCMDGRFERRAVDLDFSYQLYECICLVDLLLDDVGEESGLERGHNH